MPKLRTVFLKVLASTVVLSWLVAVAIVQIEDYVFERTDMQRDPNMACCWSDAAAKCGEPQTFCQLSIRYARSLNVIKIKLLLFK